VLRLRFDDFGRAARSHTLPRPTSHTRTILDAVRRLLAANLPIVERRGVTLVGVAVGNLDGGRFQQLELPFDGYSGGELDTALDAVRDRFGSGSVLRGSLVRHGEGLSVPLLPD
jgi:DNA polymerase-4